MDDELALVVGKDMATSIFSKSHVDIEAQHETVDDTENVAENGEDVVLDMGKNVIELSTTGSTLSKSRKRSCARPTNDSVYNDLTEQLKEIVVALKSIN